MGGVIGDVKRRGGLKRGWRRGGGEVEDAIVVACATTTLAYDGGGGDGGGVGVLNSGETGLVECFVRNDGGVADGTAVCFGGPLLDAFCVKGVIAWEGSDLALGEHFVETDWASGWIAWRRCEGGDRSDVGELGEG